MLGRYFDGNSAVAHAVQVDFTDGQLQLRMMQPSLLRAVVIQ